MVDLGDTQESITNHKVEVRKVEVVVVFTVESRGNNIGSQGAECTIKTENLILVKMLLESGQQLGDTLVNQRFQVGDGSLREVWVQVTATRAMMVLVYRSRSGSGDVESTGSGRVLVGLSGTGCVDCGIV